MREGVTGWGTAVVTGTVVGVGEAGSGVNVCVGGGVRVTVAVSDGISEAVKVGSGVFTSPDG